MVGIPKIPGVLAVRPPFLGTLAVARPRTPISSILLWRLHPETRAEWEHHFRQFGYGPQAFTSPERHAFFLDERLATAINFLGYDGFRDPAFVQKNREGFLRAARVAGDILSIVEPESIRRGKMGRRFWSQFVTRSGLIELVELAKDEPLMAGLPEEVRRGVVSVGQRLEEGIRREFLETVAPLGDQKASPIPGGQRQAELGAIDPLRFLAEVNPRSRLVHLDVVPHVPPSGPTVLFNGRFVRDEKDFDGVFTLSVPQGPFITQLAIVDPSSGGLEIWRGRIARIASLAAGLGATDLEIISATGDAARLVRELGPSRFSLQRGSPIWGRLTPAALLNDSIASLELGRVSPQGAAAIRHGLQEMQFAAGTLPEGPLFNAFWRGLAPQTRGRIAEIVSKVQTG